MMHSYLIFRFNSDSVAAKKDKITDKTKWDKYVRTKDKERVVIFANHMDKLNQDIDEMERILDHEAKVKGIVDDMKSTKQKQVQSNTIRKYPYLVKLQQKREESSPLRRRLREPISPRQWDNG